MPWMTAWMMQWASITLVLIGLRSWREIISQIMQCFTRNPSSLFPPPPLQLMEYLYLQFYERITQWGISRKNWVPRGILLWSNLDRNPHLTSIPDLNEGSSWPAHPFAGKEHSESDHSSSDFFTLTKYKGKRKEKLNSLCKWLSTFLCCPQSP